MRQADTVIVKVSFLFCSERLKKVENNRYSSVAPHFLHFMKRELFFFEEQHPMHNRFSSSEFAQVRRSQTRRES